MCIENTLRAGGVPGFLAEVPREFRHNLEQHNGLALGTVQSYAGMCNGERVVRAAGSVAGRSAGFISHLRSISGRAIY